MSEGKGDLGYYALPIIPSFEGIDSNINKGIGQALGKLGNIGKKSGKALGDGIGDGLKAAEAEVKKTADAYEKLRNKAEDSLGKIRVEEEKLAKARAGGKADQIVVAEERLAKARRDSTVATRAANDGHSKLLSAQRALADAAEGLTTKNSRLAGGLATLASRLGDVGDRFGGVGGRVAGSASNIASGLAGINTSGSAAAAAMLGVGAAAATTVAAVAALGAGAAVVGKQLYDLGSSYDDLRDKLQIETGSSGAQLEGLVDQIEKLGTTSVPASFAEIGDVAADVTRNLHLTGPAFDEVTSRLANLQRMTGEAVNVRDLGKAFRGFGVDAADQAGALNGLYEASTKSGLSVNDMLASVTKAGPALRQFGLSFGESAALVTTFEEAGVDTDKTIATLNKAFAYFADKGVPAKEGLQGVVTQIKALIDAGNGTDAANLTNKVFGAKGGVNFFELIKNGAVDLQSLSASLQSTGLDINQVSEDTSDWAETWQLLKNQGMKALEPLGTTVFNFANEKLGALADWVETHQDEIIDFFVTLGDGAITAAEWTVKGLGDIAGAVADVLIPIGDGLGVMTQLKGTLAAARGDSEGAAKLWKQAESLFSMGEGLRKLDELSDSADFSKARDALHELGEQAKDAGGHLDSLREKIAQAPEPGWFGGYPAAGGGYLAAGTTGATSGGGSFDWDAVAQAESSGRWDDNNSGGHSTSSGAPRGGLQITDGTWKAFGGTEFAPTANLASKEQQIAVAERIAFNGYNGTPAQGLGAWEAITKGMVPGITTASRPTSLTGGAPSQSVLGSPIYTGGHVENTQGSVVPRVASLEQLVQQMFPGVEIGNDWRPPDGFNEHSSGEAVDLMVKGALGDKLNNWLIANAQRLGVQYTLWNQTQWNPDGSTSGMPNRGNDTQNHRDHVHVRVQPGPSGTVLVSASDSLDTLSQTAGSSPIDLSRNSVDNRLTNAFGKGYEPGIGTPGYDEYGKPGYFRADPKQVRESDQRYQDALGAITDADAAVAMAYARREELDPDADATARMAADEAVRKAEDDARKARREAADAQTDYAETVKGTFTEAKKTAGKKPGGGDDDLSGLGGIFGSFMKETFGLDGSLFPDISNLAPVKALGSILGFAGGLGQDDGSGAGATASDPFAGMADAGAQTSGLPFGMIPGVSSLLPSSPTDPSAPAIHTGAGGQPGPAQGGPVDQSTHININNPQGDEQSIAARTRRTIMQTPRLGTYTAPAQVGGG